MKINYSLLLLPLLGLILLMCESVSIVINVAIYFVGCVLIVIPIYILLKQISKYKEEDEEDEETEIE